VNKIANKFEKSDSREEVYISNNVVGVPEEEDDGEGDEDNEIALLEAQLEVARLEAKLKMAKKLKAQKTRVGNGAGAGQAAPGQSNPEP
jgi:hypothetical protein